MDDLTNLCSAPGSIGPAARVAVPLLAEVRDTSDDAEVHAAAIEAIRALGS